MNGVWILDKSEKASEVRCCVDSSVVWVLDSAMNLGVAPGSVGRKKGAFSGFWGGALGLLRFCEFKKSELAYPSSPINKKQHTLIVSKFNKIDHLLFGKLESVIISSVNCCPFIIKPCSFTVSISIVLITVSSLSSSSLSGEVILGNSQ